MLWYDYNLSAIVVQKVDNDGNFVWNDGDPVELSSSGSCPRIATYGGDTFVVWYNVDAVMVQKIDADGNVMWGAGGLVASEMAYPNDEEIAADGNGGAYVTWATDGVPYAQYIDSEGNIAWESDLALTTQTDFSGTPQHPRHTSEDGEGGFVTTWYTSDDVIKAQRVDSMGALLWSDAGADVAMGESISYGPKITSNGQGSAVAIWVDNRYDAGSDSSSYDVMMQGISGEGVAGKPDYTPSSSSSSGCFITTLGMEN
ncbi:MAG: hypothetical protein C0609_12485 [Deltaproteobacteria bacterium]|nr:MAG: hypothetical protein C0609_12485 [Deltaproteobacteria bacterium]